MTLPTYTPHTAEAALFDNILSCESCLPSAFVPGAGPGRPNHAQSLLHSLSLIEDHCFDDSQGERDEPSLLAQRMEAKLDLSMQLLGRILEQITASLDACSVRWSIRGARLQPPGAAHLAAGTEGVLHIQPCEWLPECLQLPACVLAMDDERLWLRFPAFAPGLNDALERHLFRQHRRQIAHSRITQAKTLGG